MQRKFESVSRDRDSYKRRLEKAGEENETLKTELQDYARVKQELGPDQVHLLITLSKAKESAERERRAAEKEAQKAAKRAARSRYDLDAR